MAREVYRQAPRYDFTQPPHSGRLNYEEWEWNIHPADLLCAFASLRGQTPAEQELSCDGSSKLVSCN